MLLCMYIEVQVPNTRNKVWNLDLGEHMEYGIELMEDKELPSTSAWADQC